MINNSKKYCDQLDICCGFKKQHNYIGVDIDINSQADIIADLNKIWPFKDNTFNKIRAYDAIEHLINPIHIMNEIWRISKYNAEIDIFVPSTDGRGAFQDPTHVSYWNLNSFWYYVINNPILFKIGRSYGFKGCFTIKNKSDIYNEECEEFDVSGIIYTRVKMFAVKKRM